ncbi:hypothetical protein [Tenacibaculum maritimum]|uniref:hypothetical protein n=1 Tax=Tenacibaculum maritimum TaxID=107401 RepID=UPI0012E65487|nr:hypothetical protein [Tenacibaculum maritimum]CAA0158164.1 conserved hypothetical protein [Tenacibaculum maritimum]CAA0222260.1 conserved hypothetical protein [Tenacibaculum maritimum]
MKILVLNKQSFFDLSLIATGDANNALEIASFNSKNPSEFLSPGATIEVPENLTINEQIKDYYATNKLRPATAIGKDEIDIIQGCQGIGCWAIEVDFIVS